MLTGKRRHEPTLRTNSVFESIIPTFERDFIIVCAHEFRVWQLWLDSTSTKSPSRFDWNMYCVEQLIYFKLFYCICYLNKHKMIFFLFFKNEIDFFWIICYSTEWHSILNVLIERMGRTGAVVNFITSKLAIIDGGVESYRLSSEKFSASFFLCSKLVQATWVSQIFGSRIHVNMAKAPDAGKFLWKIAICVSIINKKTGVFTIAVIFNRKFVVKILLYTVHVLITKLLTFAIFGQIDPFALINEKSIWHS